MPLKRRTAIAPKKVPDIFSVDQVRLMASTAALEKITEDKLQDFAASMQHAALIYLGYEPTDNEVHHEVDDLVRAALRAARARKRPDAACEKVAVLVQRFSKRALNIMKRFGTLPDPRRCATQHDSAKPARPSLGVVAWVPTSNWAANEEAASGQ